MHLTLVLDVSNVNVLLLCKFIGFTVWIVGSSIIRDALYHAHSRPDGPNLGLQNVGGSTVWEFKGGMRMDQLKYHIRDLVQFNSSPKYLVLHCGGNDICAVSYTMVRVIVECKQLVRDIMEALPQTTIVWSQILPRLSWRNQTTNYFANKTRTRLNSCISAFVQKNGGKYIRYPDIVEDEQFFKCDDTHLSHLGNEIMFNTLSAGLTYFIHGDGPVFPPRYQ